MDKIKWEEKIARKSPPPPAFRTGNLTHSSTAGDPSGGLTVLPFGLRHFPYGQANFKSSRQSPIGAAETVSAYHRPPPFLLGICGITVGFEVAKVAYKKHSVGTHLGILAMQSPFPDCTVIPTGKAPTYGSWTLAEASPE